MTSIRPFQGSDLEQTVAVWNRALRRDPISVSRFASWLMGDPDYWPGPESGFSVATDRDRPVGFLRTIIRRCPNDRVGLEPTEGWLPVMAIDPTFQRRGIGGALLQAGIDYLRKADRKRVWVCGNTGSAPGYVFPGVDKDAYAGALALLTKEGFTVDHEPVAMSGDVVDFDVTGYRQYAWEVGREVEVVTLTPGRAQDFMAFLAEAFPGDWSIAARMKIAAGDLDRILIAEAGGSIVGYCQWDGEHFGPFGVTAELRGRRVGAKLFVEAVRRIRAADGRTVWFNWANEDAARFYRRFGLRETRRFAVMRKEL
ncbi:MAG: GNAT family N-acetyltransferase [bacterium]|nr:GNAT family N-acetyltransferase [bacterium]